MNEEKLWRLIRIHSIRDTDHWVLSSRKLTNAEMDKIWKSAWYTFDFQELGLNYALSGSLIVETVAFGGSKKRAEELILRFNNGEDPIRTMFGEDEE